MAALEGDHEIAAGKIALEGEKQMKTFESELTELLNRHSRENDSNTPDFILAQYLVACLAALNTGIQQRETWHGPQPIPAPPEGEP